MTERPDLHAWANAEAARRTVDLPRALAQRRAAAGQLALVALIAVAVGSLVLLFAYLQRVPMVDFVLQLLGASYWAGIAIWCGIAAVVMLAMTKVLSRWWLLLPLALLGWGLLLSLGSAGRAAAIAADWRFEARESGLAAPLPIRRGATPFNVAADRVGGLNGALVQPRRDSQRYTVSEAPCAPSEIAPHLVDDRPAIRRLAPLVRALERRDGRAPGTLCVGNGGRSRYEIEQRELQGEGSWRNPVRGVETLVYRNTYDPPFAILRQGEIDALPPVPFVSYGCSYSLNAELTGCGWFALTRPAAGVR